MARMTKEAKAAEKLYEDMFSKYACRVQFNMMDLGKMHRAFDAAVETGIPADAAMVAVVAQYRQDR